jgi:hypothetical protein
VFGLPHLSEQVHIDDQDVTMHVSVYLLFHSSTEHVLGEQLIVPLMVVLVIGLICCVVLLLLG